jgi:hypothetical protein
MSWVLEFKTSTLYKKNRPTKGSVAVRKVSAQGGFLLILIKPVHRITDTSTVPNERSLAFGVQAHD